MISGDMSLKKPKRETEVNISNWTLFKNILLEVFPEKRNKYLSSIVFLNTPTPVPIKSTEN
jgi:hypothetical protein